MSMDYSSPGTAEQGVVFIPQRVSMVLMNHGPIRTGGHQWGSALLPENHSYWGHHEWETDSYAGLSDLHKPGIHPATTTAPWSPFCSICRTWGWFLLHIHHCCVLKPPADISYPLSSQQVILVPNTGHLGTASSASNPERYRPVELGIRGTRSKAG